MLKVTPISDIFYLSESAADAPTSVAYYTDAKSEPPAKWWCPASWIVNDGETAGALDVTRVSQGRHPKTGRQIVAAKGDKRRAASDLTFSAPKSWTALWVVSDERGRARLDDMLMASVRESLDEVLASGLIETRIGKGGRIREPMAGLVAALYWHTTSREGDPQAHIHAALLNVGKRRDGDIRAINNEKLCEIHKTIGAAFRLRLADRLEACGVPVRADLEHGFVIDGQPVGLADIWSKRRKHIVDAARKGGLAGTAGRLKAVDRLVKQTRGKKAALPDMAVLEARWREEALAGGWTQQQEWHRLDRPAIVRTAGQDAAAASAVVREAIATITEKQSMFRRREVEATALTLAVGRTSASAVRKAIEVAMAGPGIVDLRKDGCLTTSAIVSQERAITRIARARQNEADIGFSGAAQLVAMADAKFSVEQKDAIDHALAAHGVSVIEGGPGVGKTTAATALRAACLHDGRRLIVAAPSWTATETLKAELAHDGPAYALDKLLHDIRAGTTTLQCGDVVLLDEAGTTGTLQMLTLLSAAQTAGAKLILQGDTSQIAAVSRGDPLALVGRAIGSQQIRTIRRQTVDWQRAASMEVQKGKIGEALASYASHGAVNIAANQEATLSAMAEAFKAAKGDAVAIAATNRQVAAVNAVLRQAAHESGLVGGREIVIQAVPRGQQGRPSPVDLPLAKGDRLILGAECRIGTQALRNATRLTVSALLPLGVIMLETEGGRTLMTTAAELARAGKGGKPVVMQHAYCLTTHAAQGATWSRTLWLASHEDARSALVAMTRHRDELKVFVDRSALPPRGEATMSVGRKGMADPDHDADERSDDDIIAAVGKSMERTTAPRNALDVVGMPEPGGMPPQIQVLAQGDTLPHQAPGPSVISEALSRAIAGGAPAGEIAGALRQRRGQKFPADAHDEIRRRAAALMARGMANEVAVTRSGPTGSRDNVPHQNDSDQNPAPQG